MDKFSRRDFLKRTGGVAGGTWLASLMPVIIAAGQAACQAERTGAGFVVLSQAEAREIEALAECIIPATDTPGAAETGVVYFIDQALDGFMSGARESFLDGVKALTGAAGGSFADLPSSRQITLLEEREDSAFFQVAHMLTITGMFCMPARGGNRDHLGWQLIGFDFRHAWAPPFGFYDREQGPDHG